MIPIYFPFTFVSSSTVARLARWFNELGVLAPTADAPPPSGSASLGWRLYRPPPGEEALLNSMETEWRRWADMHAGADLAAVMAAREADGSPAVPPAISRLRSRIRAGAAGASASPGGDPLLADRVFLRLAHGLDQDQVALREQLCHVAELEKRMHQEMDGEVSGDSLSLSLSRVPDEDLGAILTERRLAAWSRLALALEISAEVFVTDSTAVVDAVVERMGPLDALTDLSREAARQLPKALVEALASDTGATATAIYAIPLSSAAFLHHLATASRAGAAVSPGSDRCLLVAIKHN
jgi:hypothetical protein